MRAEQAWIGLSIVAAHVPTALVLLRPGVAWTHVALAAAASIGIMILSLWLYMRSLANEDSGVDALDDLIGDMVVLYFAALGSLLVGWIALTMALHKRGTGGWLYSALLALVVNAVVAGSWFLSLVVASKGVSPKSDNSD